MTLAGGDQPEIKPIGEAGTGQVREEKRAYLTEDHREGSTSCSKGDLTENDKLVYVNNVIKGKLLESKTLIRAGRKAIRRSNSQHHRTSGKEILHAIMEALEAHETMSSQALDSEGSQRRHQRHPFGTGQALRIASW